jgi:Na+-driven multidrug efflux pump
VNKNIAGSHFRGTAIAFCATRSPQAIRALVFKGLPMGAQILVVSSSMLALLSFVNRFGSEMTATYGTA